MNWMEMVVMFAARLAVTLAFGLILAFFVKLLWNLVIPGLFGLPGITYWQTVGLYIIVKLLTGEIKVEFAKK